MIYQTGLFNNRSSRSFIEILNVTIMKHMIGTEQKYNTPGFAGMVYGSRSESAEIYAVGGYTGICPEIVDCKTKPKFANVNAMSRVLQD